jgi:DEAD/DEAH box helicase domain-containing protein
MAALAAAAAAPLCRGPTTSSYLLKALNKATAATLPGSQSHTAAATAATTAADTSHGNPSPSSSSGRQSRGAAAAIAATAASELQAQIEAVLPPRGTFKERYGAAGTTIDQRRESPIVEMSLLLSEAVMHGLRTIAFCKSRKLCELVAAYSRENLRAAAPHKAQLVKVCGCGVAVCVGGRCERVCGVGALEGGDAWGKRWVVKWQAEYGEEVGACRVGIAE